MLISVLTGVLFVVVLSMVAGISDAWANFAILLLIAMFVLQGLSNADTFATFAQSVKITPPQ
jgi:hypothetical protein